MRNSFENLVDKLRENGYNIEIQDYNLYKFASISGRGIKGGFATEHDKDDFHSEYYFNGIVCIDNEKCWDKPRKCPLKIGIPCTDYEMTHLLNRLEYWGSYEGYLASDDYEYDESSLDM